MKAQHIEKKGLFVKVAAVLKMFLCKPKDFVPQLFKNNFWLIVSSISVISFHMGAQLWINSWSVKLLWLSLIILSMTIKINIIGYHF